MDKLLCAKSVRGKGNTDLPPSNVILDKESKNACYKYVFTFNNYPEDLSKVNNVLSVLGNWCYGKEIGESGTPHLQGWLRFHNNGRKRISELKKYKELSTIHFEKQKGTDEQAIKYCLEDGDYYSNFDISEYEPDEEIKLIAKDGLYQWQKELIEIVDKPCEDERTVYWLWEENGHVGKTSFCKYLICNHNAKYIDEGKKGDIINFIFNQKKLGSKTIVCIDIPRENENNCSYKSIESLKNGIIFNAKYETGQRVFNSPHVIVFSNFYPNTGKLSSDRWKIGNIINKKIVWDTIKEKSLIREVESEE